MERVKEVVFKKTHIQPPELPFLEGFLFSTEFS